MQRLKDCPSCSIIQLTKHFLENKGQQDRLRGACDTHRAMDPTQKDQNAMDIDLSLKDDLKRFAQYVPYFLLLSTLRKRDLENIRDILQLQADRHITGRVMNFVGDGEEVLKCKELVDQGFKKFEVSTILNSISCVI